MQEAVLIFIVFVVAVIIAYMKGKSSVNVKVERQDAITKSRSVLRGQFVEQLAPYLPNFPYSPTECKFLGKPIDFFVCVGMDEKNIKEIVFVEVKTGKSKTSPVEESLKEAVENKRVRWEEYRINV